MLKFARFIGANTDFATAQAFLFPRVISPESSEPVFGLVISGEGEDIFVKIRQQILNLEGEFSADFDRITDKLHALAETLKLKFKEVENLKLTLFCAKDNVFYVLQIGNNIVKILREGKDFPVTSDQEKVVSGFIKAGDKILVLSAKPGEINWAEDVINQIFALPEDGIDDAEVIFATHEQKEQNQEDLAGVKNIEPVAFILIENVILIDNQFQKSEETAENIQIPKPNINFKINLPKFNIWLFLHSSSRRLLGMLRLVPKKVFVVIGVVFLIGIISASVWFYLQNRNSQKNQRFNNLVTALDGNLSEAGNLKDSDPKAAAEKISLAKQKLSELEAINNKDPKVEEARKKIDDKETEVLKIYRNLNLELFMSLNLIKETFQTQRMSFSVGKILLLDTSEKSLVSIDTKLKTPDILAGSQQLGDAKLASLNGSNAFAYSPDKGIVHIDIDTNKTAVVSKPDSGWSSIKDLFGFSGNVYALDSGNNMIWKYAPTESGFTQKQEYLRAEANLGLGKELVIDYSVWVLTSEPDILKFTAGGSDFYALSGLNEPLTQIDSIFVTEELDSVFILDKSKNRILVTKKNGEYLAQYISDQFPKVDDFFVDEAENQIYLLMENKIYKTSLRS